MRGSSSQELGLATRQLRAIEMFNSARALAEQASAAAERTREMRMDTARRMEVLRRQHDAVISRAHAQLRVSGEALRSPAPWRAVIACRSSWFTDKVSRVLTRAAVDVVTHLDNGADAIGVVVAEQPDLLLVEDALLMVTGEEVVRESRTYSPGTRIGAQVAHGGRVGALLDAGADAVVTRQVPPFDVAQQLLALVGAPVG